MAVNSATSGTTQATGTASATETSEKDTPTEENGTNVSEGDEGDLAADGANGATGTGEVVEDDPYADVPPSDYGTDYEAEAGPAEEAPPTTTTDISEGDRSLGMSDWIARIKEARQNAQQALKNKDPGLMRQAAQQLVEVVPEIEVREQELRQQNQQEAKAKKESQEFDQLQKMITDVFKFTRQSMTKVAEKAKLAEAQVKQSFQSTFKDLDAALSRLANLKTKQEDAKAKEKFEVLNQIFKGVKSDVAKARLSLKEKAEMAKMALESGFDGIGDLNAKERKLQAQNVKKEASGQVINKELLNKASKKEFLEKSNAEKNKEDAAKKLENNEIQLAKKGEADVEEQLIFHPPPEQVEEVRMQLVRAKIIKEDGADGKTIKDKNTEYHANKAARLHKKGADTLVARTDVEEHRSVWNAILGYFQSPEERDGDFSQMANLSKPEEKEKYRSAVSHGYGEVLKGHSPERVGSTLVFFGGNNSVAHQSTVTEDWEDNLARRDAFRGRFVASQSTFEPTPDVNPDERNIDSLTAGKLSTGDDYKA